MDQATATHEERMALANRANSQIQGLAEAALAIVRDKHVDSHASNHQAVLGMLAQIRDLSDDVYSLVHGEDDVPRVEANRIMNKLGLTELADA